MQNEIQTVETETVASDVVPVETVTVETPTVSKPARKPRAPKPVTADTEAAAERVAKRTKQANKLAVSDKPAKPTQAEREAAQRDIADARRLARQCASNAVAAFYAGSSKPFKAASDRFSDINLANGKSATARQAGLMLALITYGAGNMQSDGTFTRGGFVVPARLVNANAKPGDTVRAQPESGCLGNMLGRACDFVSGPQSGRDQSAAIYRLRPSVALAEIQAAHGDKARDAAAKLLAGFDAPAKRGKRAA